MKHSLMRRASGIASTCGVKGQACLGGLRQENEDVGVAGRLESQAARQYLARAPSACQTWEETAKARDCLERDTSHLRDRNSLLHNHPLLSQEPHSLSCLPVWTASRAKGREPKSLIVAWWSASLLVHGEPKLGLVLDCRKHCRQS